MDPVIPKIPYFPIAYVGQQPDGFRISKNPDYVNKLDIIEIVTAYNTTRGNPLKRYHPLDFNYGNGDLKIEKFGLKTIEMNNNRLLFEVTKDDFDLIVTGFDKNRDLYVKVTKARS